MAKLCKWCQQVNFGAILTPREHSRTTIEHGPIYRKEYAGNGETPTLDFQHFGKTKRTGPPESYLPQIRTARYEELSSSEDEVEKFDERSDDGSNEVDGFDEESSVGEASEDDGSENEICVETGSQHGGTGEIEGLKSLNIDDRDDVGKAIDHAINSLAYSKTSQQGLDKQARSDHSDDGGVNDRSTSSLREFRNEMDEIWREIELQQEEEGWLSGLRPSEGRKPESSGDVGDNEAENLSDTASSASTWSNWSHFTEIFQIDREKQAKGNLDYFNGHLYYLGTIWDVRSRRGSCDLCAYFWHNMRTDRIIKNVFLTKSRCVLKCIEYKCKSVDNAKERDIMMLNLVAIYGYKLMDPGASQWDFLRLPFVLQGVHRDKQISGIGSGLSSNALVPFKDDMFGEARPRGEICDFNLFKQWLSFCEKQHDHPAIEAPGEMTFRLIDVQDSCIVEWQGPADESPRFVTLSYVWGLVSQLTMLTRRNRSKLLKRGSLGKLNLNSTIKDAIVLVDQMGERYLWVDALCIIQDEPKDKEVQIPQMHLIYGSAVMTIVAGHGDNANAGLPGVQPGGRDASNLKFELDDITILGRSATDVFYTHDGVGVVENYLLHSKYSSRGWTFQEALLSKRSLVFTSTQVFWECATCTWCEETHWESKTLAYFGQRAISDPTPQEIWEDNFDRRAYGGPDDKSDKFQRNSYPNLVKSYSEKQLTHDADVLSAFTGVLASIEVREKTPFFYALREKHFGNDILWGWDGPNPRRFQAGSVGLWPSWSWLSWKGKIDIPNEPRHNSYDPTDDIEPSDGIRCYVIEHDGKTELKLRVVNETGGWRFHKDYAKTGGGIFDPTWNHDPPDNTSIMREDDFKEGKASEADTFVERVQEVILNDLKALAGFAHIRPNFHIAFYTFSCCVILRTEGNLRNLYVDTGSAPEVYYGRLMKGMNRFESGSKDMFTQLVPDGSYEILHMNNNQSSQFGHMLIRWRDGIAERVCMACGPLEVRRKKFRATWKLIILG